MGYAWIFPKKNHLSIGVASTKQKVPRLRSVLMGFINVHENLREYKELQTVGHLIPLGGIDEPLHKGQVLLVGDAGGLADPLWGEGIHFAVKSAKIASEVIVGTLAVGDIDLILYTEEVKKGIVRDFKYARILAQILYTLPRLTYELLAKNQSVSAKKASLLRGELSYEGYTKILIRNIPRIIMRKPIKVPA